MTGSDPALPPPIVTAEWVEERRGSLTLCDVRYYLDGRDGRAAYRAGHLPGAVFIDMDTVLAAPAGPVVGRHPMPAPEVFAAGLGAAGVADDAQVVVYDDLNGMVAGRLVWMLRILGRPASLLDGGVASWSGPLDTGDVIPRPVTRTIAPWPSAAMATADEVARHAAAGGVVADSRAGERYRGEIEPIDAQAGHVPGAISLPFAENLDADGRFRSTDELAHRFATAGIDDRAIVYCGSGVSACHNILAAEAVGRGRPRLYVGSWSGWSSDPARPVATGEAP